MKHGKSAKKASSAKKTPSKSSRKAQSKPRQESRGKSAIATKRTGTIPTAAPRGDGRAGRSATVTFSNPAVGSAFRRAVKKYSAALRRLTD